MENGTGGMRQALLAVVLVIAPVALFSVGLRVIAPPKAAQPEAAIAPLGDLSSLGLIVADVRNLAQGGDLPGASARITDLETAWDDAEARLRPMDAQAWGHVDDAIDAALKALRAEGPEPSGVLATLQSLTVVLENPSGAAGPAGTVQKVAGIAVTDAYGHALPCEDMLGRLKLALAAAEPEAAAAKQANDLLAKATERCNADDDTRSDAFSAQGLALLTP